MSGNFELYGPKVGTNFCAEAGVGDGRGARQRIAVPRERSRCVAEVRMSGVIGFFQNVRDGLPG